MGSAFQTPVDIANRALQHVGAKRITALTDNSTTAGEINACYDKLRQAELRRNVWRFSIRKTAIAPLTTTTFFIKPGLWSSSTTYSQGAIVTDSSGNWWISIAGSNTGNTPGNYISGAVPVWQPYFGPVTADTFDSDTSYFTGQLVYENPNPGVINLYACLTNQNSTDPSTAVAWSSSTTYNAGNVVAYGGYYYMSLLNFNLNNEPDLSDDQWQANITYADDDKVCGYDGREYESLAGSNLGNNPVTDGGVHWGLTGKWVPWTAQFQGSIGNGNGWLSQPGMTLNPATFVYPLGAGPIDDIDSANIFPLPAGYLRKTLSDPKMGMIAWLGGPTGNMPNDYVMGDKYFTSQTSTPIVFRFAADIQDVSSMDPMFCEGLAARIAIEVCERLTQAPEKLVEIRQSYGQFMTEARMVNGIEEDFETIPEDEFIIVRI